MTTKQLKAKRITTQHKLVVAGKLRRESLPICEVGHVAGRVEIVARSANGFERHQFGANDLVRVED